MATEQPDYGPTYHITTEDDFVEHERQHKIKHELIVENLLLSILQELIAQGRGAMSSDEWAQHRQDDWEKRSESVHRHNTLMNDRRRLTIAIKSYLERTRTSVQSTPTSPPEKADDL